MLLLNELVLWLAGFIANADRIYQQVQKVSKLTESAAGPRPAPIVSSTRLVRTTRWIDQRTTRWPSRGSRPEAMCGSRKTPNGASMRACSSTQTAT